MKHGKKILCILLIVVLCLISVPLQSFVSLELYEINFADWFGSKANAISYTEDYYTYTVTNGEATIKDVSTSISGDITIPTTLGGYSVTTIGYLAFYDCDNLKSVTIGEGLTTIGDSAFYDCDNLKSVTIGDCVTIICYGAFSYCFNLTSINIGDGLTTIDTRAFFQCDSLKEVYYSGVEEQWKKISIGSSNQDLIEATIHYHQHAYNVAVTMSTCIAEGYTTYICECGDSYVDDYTEAKGHSYSATTTQPTCTSQGLTTYTCACSDTYTETIPATGHKDGNADYKCDNGCGYEFEKPVDPTPDTPEDPTDDCSCNCHAGGIKAFFFKILNFFQKLFGKNKVCACGVKH